MIPRRTFMGTVIGIIVGSKLPFYAKPVEKSQVYGTYLERMRILHNLFFTPIEELMKFKFTLRTRDHGEFYFPPLQEIKLTEEVNKAELWFNCGQIQIKQKFTALGISLYTPDNIWIRNANYNSPLYVSDGDKIKCDYTVEI